MSVYRKAKPNEFILKRDSDGRETIEMAPRKQGACPSRADDALRTTLDDIEAHARQRGIDRMDFNIYSTTLYRKGWEVSCKPIANGSIQRDFFNFGQQTRGGVDMRVDTTHGGKPS